MSKILKLFLIILGVIVLFIVGLSILNRTNLFLQIPIAIEYKIARTIQINKQRQEAENRRQNPPTEEQISQMQLNKELCFHNDDCRASPESLSSCNGFLRNRYYKCKGGTDCAAFGVSCFNDEYYGCEENRCKTNDLDFRPIKMIVETYFNFSLNSF